MALNRAVAVAEVDGPEAALALVDAARPRRLPPVPRGPRGPAASASAGTSEAAEAYGAAAARTENAAERAFLERTGEALPSA